MVDNFFAHEDSGESWARSSWCPNSNDALRTLKEGQEGGGRSSIYTRAQDGGYRQDRGLEF